MAIGALVLFGWSVEGFFMASEIPLAMRIATGVAAAGLVILFGIVVRDRIAAAKNEDFKGVRQ